jgi:hypothetical protein
MAEGVNKGRRTLLLLAVVFLGPMAVAMALYYTGFAWRPQGSTAHGILYQPPRPLPDADLTPIGAAPDRSRLHGKWTLIYVGPGPCDPACRTALVEMRQVRRALGRDLDRVQRLYLVTGGEADSQYLQAEHPGIAIIADGPDGGNIGRIVGASQPGDIFLADPLGNLVMRYPAGTGMKGMHADLKRLLKLSTVG